MLFFQKKNKLAPKVLFLTFEYRGVVAGGIARVINGLADELPGKLSFNVFLFQRRNRISDVSGILFNEQGKIIGRYWRDPSNAIINIIEKHRYDIVHFLNPGYASARIIKNLRVKKTKAKLVCSCHSLAKYAPQIRNLAKEELDIENYVLKNIDYVHILNQSSMQCLEEMYSEIVRSKSITIIPNGINTEKYINDSNEFKNYQNEWRNRLQVKSNIIVLCVSRWSHGKGLEFLLDAVPRVVAKWPNIRFVIAGRKEVSWENDVLSYVQKIDKLTSQLTSWVVPMGWVSDSQRNALMSIADICVMPSEVESFCYSILESMVAKVPVISTRLPCVEELFEADRDCLMYSNNDTEKLAEHILTLANSKVYRDSLASKAFVKIQDHLNWPKVAQMYIEFYEKIYTRT